MEANSSSDLNLMGDKNHVIVPLEYFACFSYRLFNKSHDTTGEIFKMEKFELRMLNSLLLLYPCLHISTKIFLQLLLRSEKHMKPQ